MSIASEIQRIKNNIAGAYTVCEEKGATLPEKQDSENLASCINGIPTSSAPVITSVNVTPTTVAQTITVPSGTDGFNPVNVSAVTSAIDSNIQAENIKKDVTILGVTGSFEGSGGGTLQSKTFSAGAGTPTSTTILPDSGYDGLSSVTVDLSYIEDELADVLSGSVVPSGEYGITREVSDQGVYQMPVNSFTFSLPDSAVDLGNWALRNAFRACTGLTSVDLSSLTTISGAYGMHSAFYACTGLTSVDLSSLTTISGGYGMDSAFYACTGLTSVDLSSLTTISGQISDGMNRAFYNCTGLTSMNFPSLTVLSGSGAMEFAFYGCTGLTSMNFPSLTDISGSMVMRTAFQACTSLTSLSFPALTSTSFGSYTNQFYQMLSGVTGCTVHFPSNLQSVIGSWSDVTAGFGGTNTTILFDLPATE